MYTIKVPFKDFKGNPRTKSVDFNLTETEVLKLLAEFKSVLGWVDSLKGQERDLETEEVIGFYNAFEEILLSAYGIPSEDGLHFRKGGRYDFEESALFSACMMEFVTNPEATSKLLEGIMPKGMDELARKADANLAAAAKSAGDEDLKTQIEYLRSQLENQQAKASS